MSIRKLSFSEAEYRQRLERVQAGMAEGKLDALLCHSMSNICYLTGYESLYLPKYYMAIVPRTGEPAIFCQDFEMHNATPTAWVADRVSYALGEDPIEGTVNLLKKRGLSRARIGVEMNSPFFPAGTYLRLKEALPEVSWLDAATVIDPVKLIKSAAEIEYVRQAGRISSDAMAAALAAVGEGRMDCEVAAAAEHTAFNAGSEYMCIAPIITVGRRSGIPHTTHRRTRIERGDSVLMEIGACVCRYTGVIMRAAFVGDPPDKVRRMAEGCRRSVESMIDNIRPGRSGHDVAVQAKAALGSIGEECLWHGYYGYSIGLGFPHDWADVDFCIREGNHRPLRPGMVFHCSTSLRDIGHVGITVSETIVVTNDGCEVMTNLPRDMTVRQDPFR